MIQDYEIRKEQKEEVLYLYFNWNNEFAKLKKDTKEKTLHKIIQDFIKNNKIKFQGTKVAIVVGGLLMTTITLNNPLPKKENTMDHLSQYAISLNINAKEITPLPLKEEKPVIENIVVPNKVLEVEKPTVSTKPNHVTTAKPVTEAKEQVTIKEEKPAEVITDTNRYVTIKRQDGSLLKLELEEYLIGVVGAEMPASFHIEALKAQAVIARTYALKAEENHVQLTDDSRTQNYKNQTELKEMWRAEFDRYYSRIQEAVTSTKGIYLTYRGKVIDAVYHSTSNTKTEDAQYVWGKSEPYLVPVKSEYDTLNKTFEETKFMAYEEISNRLGLTVTKDTDFIINGYTTGNRVESIQVGEKTFTGARFRSLLQLKSTDFEITKEEYGISFLTKGWGHGVGLSQYGAYGMARNGFTYEEILKHYYTGVELAKLQ